MAGTNGRREPIWTSAFVLQLLIAIAGAIVTTLTTQYTLRDQLRAEENARMDAQKTEIVAFMNDRLAHTLSREEWLEKIAKIREDESAEFYKISAQIQGLQNALKR